MSIYRVVLLVRFKDIEWHLVVWIIMVIFKDISSIPDLKYFIITNNTTTKTSNWCPVCRILGYMTSKSKVLESPLHLMRFKFTDGRRSSKYSSLATFILQTFFRNWTNSVYYFLTLRTCHLNALTDENVINHVWIVEEFTQIDWRWTIFENYFLLRCRSGTIIIDILSRKKWKKINETLPLSSNWIFWHSVSTVFQTTVKLSPPKSSSNGTLNLSLPVPS